MDFSGIVMVVDPVCVVDSVRASIGWSIALFVTVI